MHASYGNINGWIDMKSLGYLKTNEIPTEL